MLRFFKCQPEVYEAICQQLDQAYSYPNEATKTERTLPLRLNLPSDSQGNVYLAVANDYCEYVLPSQILPSLIESGTVEEISETQYLAVISPVQLQA